MPVFESEVFEKPVSALLFVPSAEFRARHPYHVIENGEVVGMFASLFCAAHSVSGIDSRGRQVVDSRTGYEFTVREMLEAECPSFKLRSNADTHSKNFLW